MNFLTRATLSGFFTLALASAPRSQAQEPTPAAPPQANDFYSLQQQAAAGDTQAQFALANLYFRGRSVAQDYTQALIWYRPAADQGYALAQYNLASLLEHGRGVRRDYRQSFDWYRKAADQNYPDAEQEVGYFYQCGFGIILIGGFAIPIEGLAEIAADAS